MFPKPKRVVNRKLLDTYHKMRCLICNEFCDPAHVKSRGAGGHDLPENVLNLCRRHHSEQSIGIVTFVLKYPVVKRKLESMGWEIVDLFGQKKLRHNGKKV